MVVVDPITDGQRGGSRQTDPVVTRGGGLHPLDPWNGRPLWRRGILSLPVSASLIGVLLLAYLAIAEGVVDDRRQRFDHWSGATVSGWTTDQLTWALSLLTRLGSTAVSNLVYVAMAGWLIGRGRRRMGVLMVGAAIGGQVLVEGMKQLSQRSRPEEFLPLVQSHGYSFPSGHTFAATVAYGFAAVLVSSRLTGGWRLLPLVGWAAIVAVVGLSRVYLGAHYTTDVVASLFLGSAWVVICLAAMGFHERPHQGPPPRRRRAPRGQ